MTWYEYVGIADWFPKNKRIFLFDYPDMQAVIAYLYEKDAMGMVKGEPAIWIGERTVRTSPCKFCIVTTEEYWKEVLHPGISAITPIVFWEPTSWICDRNSDVYRVVFHVMSGPESIH